MEKLNRRIDMQTCREHHEAIRILLELFPTHEPFDARAVSDLLTRLARVLITHLKVEDERLYPALEQSSEREVRETASRYRIEMGGLKAEFMALLDAFGDGTKIASNPETFWHKWLEVRKALEVRMAKEDHGLYAIADDYLARTDTA